jgi:hypothetical protein
MSYLLSENIDSILLQKILFRCIARTPHLRTVANIKILQIKKYEYFYNKTDLMMSISGNGFMGSSSSMVILDNIKLYEVDMIPFFKYFTEIYKIYSKSITATAPYRLFKV